MTTRVQAEGPITASIALVGQSPGATEVREGRPFVGPAGKLLNGCLVKAMLERARLYITNLLKEQPRKIEDFINLKGKEPTFSEGYFDYANQLVDELNCTAANVVVALGQEAFYALTDIYPPLIVKRRGSLYWSSKINKKVMACLHPSFALRVGGDPKFEYLITHDLRRAKEQSEFPELRVPERAMWIRPTFEEALAYIADIKEEVGFDIEVSNLEVSCFAFAKSAEDVMCVPLVEKGEQYFTEEQELAIWLATAKVLENPNVKVIGQNLMFDSSFLYRLYGIRVNNMEDTMIAQGTLAVDLPRGLDYLTSIYTQEPYYKWMGKKVFTEELGK